MTERGNLPTQRVNISTQKMLGGIGSILIMLGWATEIEILLILSIVGVVLLLISIYQLSKKLEKPRIFQNVLISLILAVAVTVLAFVFEELWEGIKPYVSMGDMGDEVLADIEWVILVGIVAAYAILVVSAYFYKQAFEILASTTAHNLFRIVGLLIFIGVIITPILYVLALLLMYAGYITIHAMESLKDVFFPLLIIVSYIVLAVAFFTAPKEVEVQGT